MKWKAVITHSDGINVLNQHWCQWHGAKKNCSNFFFFQGKIFKKKSLAVRSKRRTPMGGGVRIVAHFNTNAYMHERSTMGFGVCIVAGNT